jgi:hypothetical protein
MWCKKRISGMHFTNANYLQGEWIASMRLSCVAISTFDVAGIRQDQWPYPYKEPIKVVDMLKQGHGARRGEPQNLSRASAKAIEKNLHRAATLMQMFIKRPSSDFCCRRKT